jgi:hypothetical protein
MRQQKASPWQELGRASKSITTHAGGAEDFLFFAATVDVGQCFCALGTDV